MTVKAFIENIESKKAVVGIVGLGYVGLPLAIAFADKGFQVCGIEIDPQKAKKLNTGVTYLKHISADSFKTHIDSGKLRICVNFSTVNECDAVIVCVPTPLNSSREPDMRFVEAATHGIALGLRKGQLISLESSTYPGTTDELMREILERNKLRAGEDFFLVFSPEREDPGNATYHTTNIPKVVGGYTPDCLAAGIALYSAVIDKVVPVSSTRTAEMVKLFENTYRAVNIALVNELKFICSRLGIDVWEVIKAAATKPFGFQAFWPGPGLGGHCIPIDPFYLTWKARQVDATTKFIELAGEINTDMPYKVVEVVQDALNTRKKSLSNSSVLVVGVAYKPDIDDIRESPALKIIDLLADKGSKLLYHDPYIPTLVTHKQITMESTQLTPDLLRVVNCVLVVTNHKNIDYDLIAKNTNLVVDTRNCVPKNYNNVVPA